MFCPSLAAFCFVFINTVFTLPAGADENTTALKKAKTVVKSYRELRENCAQGNFDERRACIRELSRVSEQYRIAKEVIANHKLNGSPALASYN